MKSIIYFIILIVTIVGCSTSKEVVSNKKEIKGKSNAYSTKEDLTFKGIFFEALKEKALGNYESALTQFEKCLVLRPNHSASLHESSLIYDKEGDFLTALEKSEKAVKKNATNKWYLLQLALMQKKGLKYKEALKSYEKLVELDAKNLDFLIGLSELYMRNDDPEKAADTFDKIKNITGENDEIAIQKHQLYMQAGNIDKAIKEIENLVNKNPKNPRYLNILGQLYDRDKQPEKALALYKRIVEQNPKDGMASLSLARYYKTNNQPDEVRKYMPIVFKDEKISPSLKLSILIEYVENSTVSEDAKNDALSLIKIMQNVHPKNVKSFVIAGDFYLQHNELVKARESFVAGTKLESNSYPIWAQILVIDSKLQNNLNLYNDSKSALDLFPTQPIFYLYNGIGAKQLKKYEEAINIFNSGKELVFDNPDLLVDFHQNIGEVHHELKQYKKADESFEKALSINGDLPFLLNNYSFYLSVRKENLKRAAEMSKKSNELSPNQPSFEDTYGWVLFQQGKYKEAKEWTKKALDHGGKDSGVILEHYGDILFKLNKTDEALIYWKKALSKEGYSDLLNKKIKEKKYFE